MFMIMLIGTALAFAMRWDFSAKIVPMVVGIVALTATALSLFNDMCRKQHPRQRKDCRPGPARGRAKGSTWI